MFDPVLQWPVEGGRGSAQQYEPDDELCNYIKGTLRRKKKHTPEELQIFPHRQPNEQGSPTWY